jgi:hypothetical protein
MNGVQFEPVTILILAVVNMLVGYVWYSRFLFGGMSEKACKTKACEKHAAIQSFFVSLVIAYVLVWFGRTLSVTGIGMGMQLGFWLWLGFVATTQISSVIWMGRPFKLFLVHTGGKLLSYLVMGGILGA